ncbi:MAG: carboxypeptidase regulatory-like domain-containing protein [Bryobacterales bacterium]|jgi:hypothetical protein|nr:carboxypeptidase regulatory-like domain-containing protein [Bryobacterales bacterium]
MMMNRRFLIVTLVLALGLAPLGFAQSRKKKGDDEKLRSVEGVVSDAQEKPVEGAVVQLKNMKTLQIRSFIADRNGAFQFGGLDRNIDYQLRAEYQGARSATRTLSTFDSRSRPVINLKLEGKN